MSGAGIARPRSQSICATCGGRAVSAHLVLNSYLRFSPPASGKSAASPVRLSVENEALSGLATPYELFVSYVHFPAIPWLKVVSEPSHELGATWHSSCLTWRMMKTTDKQQEPRNWSAWLIARKASHDTYAR